MNLYRLLRRRAEENNPVTVGLIGGGKFGSMFLAQARLTTGMQIVAIADLRPENAAPISPPPAGAPSSTPRPRSPRRWPAAPRLSATTRRR